MKTRFKVAPLALAVAALFACPFALAENGGDPGGTDTSTSTNTTKVDLEKTIKITKEIAIRGQVAVDGRITVNSAAMAVIDDKQINYDNSVSNEYHTNSATASGSVLQDAQGNIGLNISAGDNNQQANAAALVAAAQDASFVFDSSDAEVFALQRTQNNSTSNLGSTNTASIGGNVLRGALGNIGVNVAAGDSNQQKNDLAAAVGGTRMAEASVAVKQVNEGNSTSNEPFVSTTVVQAPINLAISATGKYAGISDMKGNQYPDTWGGFDPHDITNNGDHSCCARTGHFDLDTETQGGLDRPQGDHLGANGQPAGDPSTGGSLSFNEAGDLALSGVISGFVPVVVPYLVATANTASLSGNALNGAQGNIGVNITAGTNNQQYNGLAIAVGSPTGGGGGGGGGGGFAPQ